MQTPEQPGIVRIDFARHFPHKFWISNWSEDETYPDGFRYKLLGVRNEREQVVELVLLLEERSGEKQEMHRAQAKLAAADGYASVFVNGLTKKLALDFEKQDFSAVRTPEEFEQAVAAYGWQGEDWMYSPGGW